MSDSKVQESHVRYPAYKPDQPFEVDFLKEEAFYIVVYLIESTNEGWNNSISITETQPQPDDSVGFKREAFTEDQLKGLEPFVDELTDWDGPREPLLQGRGLSRRILSSWPRTTCTSYS